MFCVKSTFQKCILNLGYDDFKPLKNANFTSLNVASNLFNVFRRTETAYDIERLNPAEKLTLKLLSST